MMFKKREETLFIYIVLKDNLPKDFTKDSLFREARLRGELDTGYHFILHNTGILEADRDKDCVAQYDFPEYRTSLYVLAESIKGKLTDAQKIIIKRDILPLYPDAEVLEVKSE